MTDIVRPRRARSDAPYPRFMGRERELWRLIGIPDAKSGALDEPVTWSSPIVIDSGGVRQLIVWTSAKTGGEFVCLKTATGEEMWKTNSVTDLVRGASIHVTARGDSAFLFNDRGELIKARLAPGNYEEISRTKLIEPTLLFGSRKFAWSAPAFAYQNVYVRNDQELICVSLAANLY